MKARPFHFDDDFEEQTGPRPRVIRGQGKEFGEEEPSFKLQGVLRAGSATIADSAYEIQLLPLEADFPLPDHLAGETPPFQVDEKALRAEIEAEWSRKLEDAALRAREEAYDAGYRTAKQELEGSVSEIREALSSQMAMLRDTLLNQIEAMERTAVSLALDAASSILEAPLTEAARLSSERALANAIEQLAGDGAIDIVLHPIDYLRIQETGVDEQLSATFPPLRWHPDEKMTEGDWSARSNQAVIRRIRKELLSTLAERLGADVSSEEA
jgi:flagellar assembly protein FliH